MAVTNLKDLINPEVMAPMVSAKLPKAIKFSVIAGMDNTLAGNAGNTITVPKYAYIGDAEDVAEGVAMGTTVLTASTTTVTIKKAGKAVEITDEAVLSGYGDPVGEATNQLAMSIASKIDNDCLDALYGAKLVYNGTSAKLAYTGLVNADAMFGEETETALNKLMWINPLQEKDLRLDPDFIDRNKFGGDVMASGVIGKIAGIQVRKSKKIKLVKYEKAEAGETTIDAENIKTIQPNCIAVLAIGDKVNNVATPYYANPIVVVSVDDPNNDPKADPTAEENPAITIYMKRDVNLEADRDILAKTSVASADEHYGVALSNESKVVLAKFKA